MILPVIQMVLPIVLLLGLGTVCRKKQLLRPEGLAGLKTVVGDLCLPVVLFNAFFTANYSLSVVLTFLAVYLGFGAALLAGFALRRLAAPHGRFFPFLLTSAEGGMLGYALYGVLMGEQSGFAAVDLGQTVFAYTAFLGALTMVDGQQVSIKGMVRNIVTNKCCIGMALGILLGAAGVGQWVLSGPAGGIVTGAISMLTAPTSALVLLIVGYELELDRSLLRPVAVTVLCRLAVMGLLLAAVSFIVFRLIPYDRSLQIALMILYALPAPFIIPLFADVGDEGKYISTTLSVHTICTVLLFAAIAAFSLT
ncbi:AEC family transporter [uncultured Oscillibacter sp.]|uniref:AEC family transporter n=1 Tax=uncultured Oscillibacter sp. TaxID=876091 RepID=UPI00260003E3|nr:AEC family transporter [uncultured Oscillibacter sp.]